MLNASFLRMSVSADLLLHFLTISPIKLIRTVQNFLKSVHPGRVRGFMSHLISLIRSAWGSKIHSRHAGQSLQSLNISLQSLNISLLLTVLNLYISTALGMCFDFDRPMFDSKDLNFDFLGYHLLWVNSEC